MVHHKYSLVTRGVQGHDVSGQIWSQEPGPDLVQRGPGAPNVQADLAADHGALVQQLSESHQPRDGGDVTRAGPHQTQLTYLQYRHLIGQ